jgi:hypothetical protein
MSTTRQPVRTLQGFEMTLVAGDEKRMVELKLLRLSTMCHSLVRPRKIAATISCPLILYLL